MSHLIGNWAELGWTAVKALLLFAVAVVGLRLSERRVVAQLNVFDFVVTVAVGAIVGRTATSSTESFATGAVALITLLIAHRVVAELRRRGWLGALLDRHPSVLVAHGRLQTDALRSAGLTRSDVYRLLRQAGAGNLQSLEYVLYESHGGITVVRTDQQRIEPIRAGLAEAGIDPQ
ncbi:MAG: YetF domain-containing protein [Mycobacterium sp.]